MRRPARPGVVFHRCDQITNRVGGRVALRQDGAGRSAFYLDVARNAAGTTSRTAFTINSSMSGVNRVG